MTLTKDGPKPQTSPEGGLSRRTFLKAGMAAGTLAVVAACTPGVTTTTPPGTTTTLPPTTTTTPPPSTTPPAISPVFEAIRFFDRRQAMLVHAAAGRIIPGTAQDPGAKEAAVVVYIDRALDGYDRGLQRAYTVGLNGMEAYAQAKYSNGFVDLTDAQQDDILTNMDGGTDEAKQYIPDPADFFGILLDHVREGMFGDPIYGGNRDSVGWKLEGHSGVVFDHQPSVMACDVDFPKEYMGIAEYYAEHIV